MIGPSAPLAGGESEEVIMVEVGSKRWLGRTESGADGLPASLWFGSWRRFPIERNGALFVLKSTDACRRGTRHPYQRYSTGGRSYTTRNRPCGVTNGREGIEYE